MTSLTPCRTRNHHSKLLELKCYRRRLLILRVIYDVDGTVKSLVFAGLAVRGIDEISDKQVVNAATSLKILLKTRPYLIIASFFEEE